MKKSLFKTALFIFLALLFCATCYGFAAEESEESIYFKGIITSVTDIDGDGVLDKGGYAEIMLMVESPARFVDLRFSEKDFCNMTGEQSVSTSTGSYALNTVLRMEYYGDDEITKKDYFSESDIEKIELGFSEACFITNGKKQPYPRKTVVPEGNEIYSTYIVGGEIPKESTEANLSYVYNEESGEARLFYKSVEYTVVTKLFKKAENPIVITENGKPLSFSEIGNKIKSFGEGEFLALFGDIDGDGIFEIMDIKKYCSFAPISSEWSAYAGIKGEAFSYVLFDKKVRISAPLGRTFSAVNSEGAGLSMAVADESGEYRFSAPLFCYNEKEEKYASFEAVRGEKIISAEAAGEYIKVNFESGRSALFPGESKLADKNMTANFFYFANKELCSQAVLINKAECSWFASLAKLYSESGADSLTGKTVTAVFGSDGAAVYIEITQ